VRTVESLYQALSRQDFSAARALFSGEAADQFDPAFFRQFTRVEVADLQPTARSAGSVTLDGVVSFIYPDGSLQKEARTFTLDTNSDPPRVVASAFGMVVRPRSPKP
jgi:serine/threonine-protein kinase